MLRLRRGIVVAVEPPDGGWQQLTVDVGEVRRPACADVALVGRAALGDEVVVNVEALELSLGSGGFDLVHVNLSRGLDAPPAPGGSHVMKLNYTSLQHAVEPVEETAVPALAGPVAVLALHGQLATVAWSAARRVPGLRLGYVQTWGGALPGALSRTVPELRDRGLLTGHVTAGPAYGGEREALTIAGALAHGFGAGWHAAVCGPGPGIVGSGSALGHGGLAALDAAHAALALGCPTLVVPRMSSGDARTRHRGLSHHTATVLDLVLAPVRVPVPPGTPPRDDRHEWRHAEGDLDGYRASGLPARTMGRSLEEDPLFFAAGLAGGTALGDMVRAA